MWDPILEYGYWVLRGAVNGVEMEFRASNENHAAWLCSVIEQSTNTHVKLFCENARCSDKGGWIVRPAAEARKGAYVCDACGQIMKPQAPKLPKRDGAPLTFDQATPVSKSDGVPLVIDQSVTKPERPASLSTEQIFLSVKQAQVDMVREGAAGPDAPVSKSDGVPLVIGGMGGGGGVHVQEGTVGPVVGRVSDLESKVANLTILLASHGTKVVELREQIDAQSSILNTAPYESRIVELEKRIDRSEGTFGRLLNKLKEEQRATDGRITTCLTRQEAIGNRITELSDGENAHRMSAAETIRVVDARLERAIDDIHLWLESAHRMSAAETIRVVDARLERAIDDIHRRLESIELGMAAATNRGNEVSEDLGRTIDSIHRRLEAVVTLVIDPPEVSEDLGRMIASIHRRLKVVETLVIDPPVEQKLCVNDLPVEPTGTTE